MASLWSSVLFTEKNGWNTVMRASFKIVLNDLEIISNVQSSAVIISGQYPQVQAGYRQAGHAGQEDTRRS